MTRMTRIIGKRGTKSETNSKPPLPEWLRRLDDEMAEMIKTEGCFGFSSSNNWYCFEFVLLAFCTLPLPIRVIRVIRGLKFP